MNEMDLKTKIEGLEKAITEHKDFSTTYEDQLKKAQQELKDYNKPELTPSQMDDIFEAVETGVGNFDFSDTNNFEIEYGIDYDGRVNCESHEFRNSDDLARMVAEKVCNLFKEADCPEDDNSQVNNATHVEKII